MLTGTEKSILRTKLEKYEDNIAHMYLDIDGNITIGVGHLIPSLKAAQRLNLVVLKTGARATRAQIKTDYEAVQKQRQSNALASYYKKYTKLIMMVPEVNRLTNQHINKFYQELTRIYPDFDNYPTEVQLALFDMIFNLGMPNLQGEYPKLNKAVKAKNWAGAANQSHRKPPISEARNNYVKALFEAAAKEAKQVSSAKESVQATP